MRIFAYLRVSSEEQVKSGLGLEAQLKACREFATKQGLELSDVFKDEGLSGALPMEKREGLMLAISSLNKGDVLVVAKRDRLSRDVDSLAFIKAAISNRKALLFSASGEGNGNSPSELLMTRIFDAFSEHERLIIKARTKAALAAKKAKGERVGHVPFGFRLANDHLHLEIDAREQAILSQMQALREKGFSLREIATALNKKDTLTRDRAYWNHIAIFRILSRRRAA